jgi:hypothetical protein
MKPFETAMSPATIREIVGEWPGFREMGISIDGCEVRKVRPKKHGGLEVQYQFDLIHGGGARPFRTTVLGEFYEDDMGEKDYLKLLEGLNGTVHLFADPMARGFTLLFADLSLKGFALYDAEHRLWLHSLIADKKLPGLQVALDPTAMKPILGDYWPPSACEGEQILGCEVEILRYKPGKRCTLRYRLENGGSFGSATGQRSLIGKIYEDEDQAERVYSAMCELARRGFGPDAPDGIRVPQPLGYIDRLRMVLMEDVAGTPLVDHLSSPQLDDHLRTVARALVKIHHCPVPVEKERAADDQVSRLKRAVSQITAARPDLEEALDRCLRRIQELSDDLPAHEPVLVHGSLYPKEVLLGGSELTIVDLDKIALSDPALDVGNFLAHIVWSGLQLAWPEEVARSHARTFLSAYRQEIPAALMQRIDFYHRACLLRIACRVSLRPKWQHLAIPLLAACKAGVRGQGSGDRELEKRDE